MAQRLILGTVRGRIGGQRHTVALTDGSVLRVQFEGEVMPRIGADVIGILDDSSGENRIELVPDVAKRMLKGKRTKIIPFGRPDVTARMLAYLLDGTGPALIRPGVGGIIERTPIIKDPDLRWALSILEPEAARLGLALNVVDRSLSLRQPGRTATWSTLFCQPMHPASAVRSRISRPSWQTPSSRHAGGRSWGSAAGRRRPWTSSSPTHRS